MLSTSTDGALTGNSPTDVSRVIEGSPPTHVATSVDVPPISNVRIRSKPARAATYAAPWTPPAGPDSTVWTGVRRAESRLIRPPSERTTWSSRPAPTSSSRSTQARQIAIEHGRDVGVHHGRDGALVFAELGHDLRRDRDRQQRRLVGGELGDRALVRGVGERVHQRHGERLDPAVAELRDRRAGALDIELAQHDAVRSDALVERTRVLQRGDRLWLLVDHPAEQRPRGPRLGQMQDRAKAVGHEQPDAGSPLLEYGVGRHRRTVKNRAHPLGRDARRLGDRADSVDHPQRLILGRARHLGHPQLPRLGVVQHKVGEGPTDVDPEPQHGLSLWARSHGCPDVRHPSLVMLPAVSAYSAEGPSASSNRRETAE